ncbi:3,4-dihydroxy-2-butanone 4-phosphate synthase (plasmid) [Rhizobium freirei PRF 81]|uniref:3,4-dihydroxy-2-butanone 4-phosphate synthase n=1 Tax=Rhizobium freirei PRF 81 TaxID=363754 RepID=N6U039_9HYPH|nr:3,4-dihydroxy-2-butanone-4-phosphate synthase [Rhizobium freirei]ENN83763.1 3,4-dihydroxy-2-butanone 4-phosphate synthase [Rhizobium freirei PRF 81]
MKFAPIESAVKAIAAGEMIIVVDDEDRENEGDILVAADKVTNDHVAFMMRYARGLICVPMTGDRLDELDIPLMVERNSDSMHTAFTVSVDLIQGVSTGISAEDRAKTIRALADASTVPEDLSRPGHIFPLRANPSGVLGRPGHTEAAVDFARLAGLEPAGVICEIANDDGTMARLPELSEFAERHGLLMVTIEALIEYCREIDKSGLCADHAAREAAMANVSYLTSRLSPCPQTESELLRWWPPIHAKESAFEGAHGEPRDAN